jgi:glycosyltransferase involved in cell wall biosynthesis
MISIVTGTLNRLEILKHVIDNTVNKSDKLELVLVDGGSTDGTIEYIKSLNNPNINLIEVGERSSYPHFMNIGIKTAKYDWILQWNDDVLLVNEWEDVFKLLEANTHDVYIFDWTRGTFDDYNKNKINMNPVIFGSKWIRFHDCMNFGLYRKRIFKEIGMYDNKFKYYECDHDMTNRCLRFGYKSININHVKVFEINTEKKSIPYGEDRALFVQNAQSYSQGILPETIEKL